MTVKLAPRQEALYDAEAMTIDRVGIRWDNIPEINDYLYRLVGSEWFGEKWPNFLEATAVCRPGNTKWSYPVATDKDAKTGFVYAGVIHLAGKKAFIQSIVLHELAHLLAPKNNGHNSTFAAILLTLVRHEMGFNAWADFYHALRSSPSSEFTFVHEGV